MKLYRHTSSVVIQIQGLINLLRPKQWVKNSFVLAPLLFTGKFSDPSAIFNVVYASLFFCVASSIAYIVNDIHDVEKDRLHPQKSKTRPIAAGIISRSSALYILFMLCFLLMISRLIVPQISIVLGGYLVLNLAYTFYLKHRPVIDIFTIAVGFVLRVYAGAMALNVPVSSWMFITTLCLALYLAAIKRRQELSQNGADGRAVLEKYSLSLIDRYAEMSATGALLFYSMFVMSTKPDLVITIPLVLFGLFRYWFVVEALDGGESPTDVLLVDWPLLMTVLLWACSCGWILVMVKG